MERQIRIPCPGREWVSGAAASSYGECKNKDHDLCAAVQCRRDEIVPFDKESGVVFSNIPLKDECDNEEGREPTVDSNKKIPHKPEND